MKVGRSVFVEKREKTVWSFTQADVIDALNSHFFGSANQELKIPGDEVWMECADEPVVTFTLRVYDTETEDSDVL